MRPVIDHLYPHTPLVVAHRGASAYAPENTLASFELAVKMGADAVELDCKLAADGEIVVIHDSTVDRTTGGAGRVAELTVKELKALDAGRKFDPKFAGERIPTLAEVFESVGRQVFVNVELTNYTTLRDGLGRRAAELVRRMGMEKRVWFSSFNPAALMDAKKAAPNVPTAVLYRRSRESNLRRFLLVPFTPHEMRHPEASLVDERAMRWLRSRGYRVNVWTINGAGEMRRLMGLGVDGIITNYPDTLRSVLRP